MSLPFLLCLYLLVRPCVAQTGALFNGREIFTGGLKAALDSAGWGDISNVFAVTGHGVRKGAAEYALGITVEVLHRAARLKML